MGNNGEKKMKAAFVKDALALELWEAGFNVSFRDSDSDAIVLFPSEHDALLKGISSVELITITEAKNKILENLQETDMPTVRFLEHFEKT